MGKQRVRPSYEGRRFAVDCWENFSGQINNVNELSTAKGYMKVTDHIAYYFDRLPRCRCGKRRTG